MQFCSICDWLFAEGAAQSFKKKSFKPAGEETESRRDQEEGGELDPHEEVSPEEIKSREVELGLRVASVISQRRS